MASKHKSGPQDLPPKGGYNPIQTTRVAVRRIISRNYYLISYYYITAG